MTLPPLYCWCPRDPAGDLRPPQTRQESEAGAHRDGCLIRPIDGGRWRRCRACLLQVSLSVSLSAPLSRVGDRGGRLRLSSAPGIRPGVETQRRLRRRCQEPESRSGSREGGITATDLEGCKLGLSLGGARPTVRCAPPEGPGR